MLFREKNEGFLLNNVDAAVGFIMPNCGKLHIIARWIYELCSSGRNDDRSARRRVIQNIGGKNVFLRNAVIRLFREAFARNVFFFLLCFSDPGCQV